MPDLLCTSSISDRDLTVIRRTDYRPPLYLVDQVTLHVELYESHTLVTSSLKISLCPSVPLGRHELILNGDELILESIKLNSVSLSSDQYILTLHALIIPLDIPSAEIVIVTKIFPEKNTALLGLYRPKKTYCTQCEAEGFRRITFYPDHPDILAKFTTIISADKTLYPILLSNGNLTASGNSENGRHWVRWEDPFPKPSYLFALVAGDFDLLTDTFKTKSGRMVDLRIYVEKGLLNQTNHAMYSLKAAMRWDEEVYGREYDLNHYMIVAISDFNAGAMENKGLNIFNTQYILAKPETATDDDYIHILSVIGHEYFHNWTGNRVTCRDWFQLSLKEGLTIFRNQSFTEDLISKAVMRIRDVTYLRESQFLEDAGPLAHPVRPESYIEINNFYTTTVYNKGAEVLRMLRTLIGVDIFKKGMDLYFSRFDGQAVTIDDFVNVMEDVSHTDLTQFRLWYSQAGTPIITVKTDYDPTQQLYTLQLSQYCPPTPSQSDKLPFYMPVRFGLLDQSGKAMSFRYQEISDMTDVVLPFSESSQSFVLKGVIETPVLSILREFSAPVKLQYPYTDAELMLLMKHDVDAFNRWEAGQIFLLSIIRRLINDYQHDASLVLPKNLIESFSYLIEQDKDNPFLLAEMLTIPSERYIAEQMEIIDVDAIHAVREFIIQQLSIALKSVFHSTYQQDRQDVKDVFDVNLIGRRQLKNVCLSYLLSTGDAIELGLQQFHHALTTCMSDVIPALKGLVNIDFAGRRDVLQAFYQAWQHDALVMDKWLSVQAACKLPDTLQAVKLLLKHPAFDIKNPNKVYALIGGFGNHNPTHFHVLSGEGYAFLAETVKQLDKLNPQIAARMVKPLIDWRRYDKERQDLMRGQLSLLMQADGLSKDLYEIVSKSLEEGCF